MERITRFALRAHVFNVYRRCVPCVPETLDNPEAGVVIAAADAREPVVICSGCGADEMGCQVKLGLGGRRCCADCGHDDDRRGDDHVDHHDLDHLEHHDLDHLEHHDLDHLDRLEADR